MILVDLATFAQRNKALAGDFADRLNQTANHVLHQVAIFRFSHHPDQRFRTGLSDQQTTCCTQSCLCFGYPVFDDCVFKRRLPSLIPHVFQQLRHGLELVHATNGYLMVCQKQQNKLLPAGVINEQLDEKVLDIETREARQVSRKERRSLRDEIEVSLLPRAFVRSQLLFAYLSPQDRLLVVDAASATRAEMLLGDLREALGSLSVVPLATRQSPTGTMTGWIDRGIRLE